jgi:hypothetical protein
MSQALAVFQEKNGPGLCSRGMAVKGGIVMYALFSLTLAFAKKSSWGKSCHGLQGLVLPRVIGPFKQAAADLMRPSRSFRF